MEISSNLRMERRSSVISEASKSRLHLKYRASISNRSRRTRIPLRRSHPSVVFLYDTCELALFVTNLEKISTLLDYDCIYFARCIEIISCFIDQPRHVNQLIPAIVDQGRCHAWKVFDVIAHTATSTALSSSIRNLVKRLALISHQ